MRVSRFSDRLGGLFQKIMATLRQQAGEIDMGIYETLLSPLDGDRPDARTTLITIGKTNFVVNERFATDGNGIDELLERLVIEKCRQIS